MTTEDLAKIIPPDFAPSFLEDPDYLKFLETAQGQIWSGCWGFSVIELCLNLKDDEACAVLKLVGIELAKTCSRWSRSGDVLKASIGLGTQNTGQWKLEDPRINVEHNTSTDNGRAAFSAVLYEYDWRRFRYRERRKWNNETILTW